MRETARQRDASCASTARLILFLMLVPGLTVNTIGHLDARADRIRMRGGGEIRGHVLEDPERPEMVLVQTLNGVNPIAMPRASIAEVIEEHDIFDDYYAQHGQIPATAEDQYAFGLWCEENRLTGLAQVHYQRAVELDASHGPAHKKLGHVEYGGEWITYDELREAQGMVKHEGRWISREDKQALDAQRLNRAELIALARQIRVLRQALMTGTDEERAETEAQLAALNDPAAVPALVEVLADDPQPTIRELLIQLLQAIPGPEATEALMTRSMTESDRAIRRAAIAALSRRNDPWIVQRFTGLLSSKDPTVVGRAAEVLGDLGSMEAVPALVRALVRVERRPGWVRPAAPVAAAPVGGVFGTGRSIPVVTGPVVGDGVVAFGAAGVPFLEGAAIGGVAAPAAPAPPRIGTVTQVHRNAEVLLALQALTGRNFGYDEAAWNRWIAQAIRPRNEPARRVPQP